MNAEHGRAAYGTSALGGRRLGIEVLELAGGDLASSHKLVDLALFQANDPAEPVRGQLALIDQPVEGPGDQAKGSSRFFRRKPVSVCLRHARHRNTLSRSLNHFYATSELWSAA